MLATPKYRKRLSILKSSIISLVWVVGRDFPYKEEAGGSSPSTATENACRHLGFPSFRL